MRKLIRADANYAKVYYFKAMLLKSQGDKEKEEALACYNEAIRYNPTYIDAYYGKADLLHQQGAWKDALACYNEIIRCNPNESVAYYDKANLLLKEALENYDEAIRRDPKVISPADKLFYEGIRSRIGRRGI